MEVVKLIQPHEFGDNFILEDGKWKVKFPPIPEGGIEISKDANNFIVLGEDGGMFADAVKLHAFALVQDNENMKIHLYRHQANLEFNVATATLVSSIDMLELNGQYDDITITDAVVTFKDVQTDSELVFDTDQFQNVSGLTSDNSIDLLSPEDNESTTKQVAVSLRPYDNLVQETPEGLLVVSPEGLHIEHSLMAESYMVDVAKEDDEIEHFIRTINGNEIYIPAVTLRNARNKTLGAIIAKIPDKLHTREPQ